MYEWPYPSSACSNVSGAQRELLKFYANMSSNVSVYCTIPARRDPDADSRPCFERPQRWLMLQIMGVLIIFFLLFVLVT